MPSGRSGRLATALAKQSSIGWVVDVGRRALTQYRIAALARCDAGEFALPQAGEHGLPSAIADKFQDGLVHMIPDSRRIEKGTMGYTQVMGEAGSLAKFTPLATRREEFWVLVMQTTDALSEATMRGC
jgi:hypothetical protein